MSRARRAIVLAGTMAVAWGAVALSAGGGPASPGAASFKTTTPIKHLVVIFQENVSFDHYFATYPVAVNPPGEPRFVAAPGTPAVHGLPAALRAPHNPNASQPSRLDRSQAHTCDQDHYYADELRAADGGRMDRFVETVGQSEGACPSYGRGDGLVMGYYDGNTVTAMWNYAQAFAMSDNHYGTEWGPSTVGALNLISGDTRGASPDSQGRTTEVAQDGTLIGDPQPERDRCDFRDTSRMRPGNRNVGDLLNSAGVTWGWFEGGFRDCTAAHTSLGGVTSRDYIPHHEAFQYYASTANPDHLPPLSSTLIGATDQANHQYDLADLFSALDLHRLPAVSFIKAPAYADGHAGYSGPLDEQRFLVETINRLEQSPEWRSMAILIAYDDSDGWYDHRYGPQVEWSANRRGYGPRLPLLAISPFSRHNFVDHGVSDQTSILRFIEDNWSLGRIGGGSFDERAGSLNGLFAFGGPRRPALLLDPSTGQPQRRGP